MQDLYKKNHKILMNKNILYTAVTRAKKLVVLVGSKQNIYRMVKNTYTATRYSMLKTFLEQAQKEYDLLFGDLE